MNAQANNATMTNVTYIFFCPLQRGCGRLNSTELMKQKNCFKVIGFCCIDYTLFKSELKLVLYLITQSLVFFRFDYKASL